MRELIDDGVYNRAVADCTAHHAVSKTFSGQFLKHHVHQIRERVGLWGCASVLDYGCGKAVEYGRPITADDKTPVQYWGVPVKLFDPCLPDYATRPVGPFGLVIAVQVLCWVPIPTLVAVINDLYAYAENGIYVAEKIGPVKKQILRDQLLAPRYTAAQWVEALARPGNGKHCTFAACYQREGYLEVKLHEVQ